MDPRQRDPRRSDSPNPSDPRKRSLSRSAASDANRKRQRDSSSQRPRYFPDDKFPPVRCCNTSEETNISKSFMSGAESTAQRLARCKTVLFPMLPTWCALLPYSSLTWSLIPSFKIPPERQTRELEIRKRFEFAKTNSLGHWVTPKDLQIHRYRNYIVPVLPRTRPLAEAAASSR